MRGEAFARQLKLLALLEGRPDGLELEEAAGELGAQRRTVYRDFRVLGALNYLKHEHLVALADKCPVLRFQPYREPGSFWLVRN